MLEANITKSPIRNLPVVYESGVHAFPVIWEGSDIEERFESGDLRAHLWNPEIAMRMRSYSPYVLGLDSLSPSLAEEARFVYWPWLPGSSKEMSGRDSLYVVAGDILHWQIVDQYPEENQVLENLRKEGWGDVENYGKQCTVEYGLTAALGILTGVAAIKTKGKTTRRSFLKLGLGVISAAITGVEVGRASPIIHSYSRESKSSPLQQFITEVTKFRFSRSVWLEGRTALVVSKTMDAMDILDLPEDAVGSVVMGFPHSYEATSILSDKNFRRQAIQKYALEFEQDIIPPLIHSGILNDTAEDREWVRTALVSTFALTDVCQISEPPTLQTDDPIGMTARLQKRVRRYYSPEVVEALSTLGTPDESIL